jgi:hypothetical protein
VREHVITIPMLKGISPSTGFLGSRTVASASASGCRRTRAAQLTQHNTACQVFQKRWPATVTTVTATEASKLAMDLQRFDM